MEDIINFVLDSMLSGTIGNATYDTLKNLLGDKFNILFEYLKNNEKEEFKKNLEKLLKENDELKKQIACLRQKEQKEILFALEEAMLALKQMPGRLQEAADAGKTYFSFDEAREKLEQLYIIAKIYCMNNIVKKLHEFEKNYNGWINLINQAINDNATIADINNYHKKHIIEWFSKNIYNPIKLRMKKNPIC
jgi:hypothetical protein